MTNSSDISKAARRLAVELDAIGGISPLHVVSPANILELENTFREITQARTHAVLTGNRRCMPGISPQRRGVGKTLPGLQRFS